MPAMNQIIYWNSEIHFSRIPCSSSERVALWEDRAAAMTDVILEGNSAMMLISGVLVVGGLPVSPEEAFFRGGLQRIFCGHGVNASRGNLSHGLYITQRGSFPVLLDLSRGCCLEPPSIYFLGGPAVVVRGFRACAQQKQSCGDICMVAEQWLAIDRY